MNVWWHRLLCLVACVVTLAIGRNNPDQTVKFLCFIVFTVAGAVLQLTFTLRKL
jgi:hypothetical protein